MPTLSTIVTFNGTNGANPHTELLVDSTGDLFGTTASGGTSNDGTVFEIVKTGSDYASTPMTLVSFNGTDGGNPYAGLTFDAAGNIFGATENGGANGYGTLFEIVKTGGVYTGTPTVLASINATGGNANGVNPFGRLVADGSGNFFGTTAYGGVNGGGTVFELGTTRGYSVTPGILASLSSASTGANPFGGLIVDASGNLIGTTHVGGSSNDGTVFEIAKTADGYAGTATVLVNFNGANGATPYAGLTADAAGNLFGTTEAGGANGDGTVFEIAKTGAGYGTAPVLASFNGTNGYDPAGGVIVDAGGNLFGTTVGGGTNGFGTVFEIAKTGGSYSGSVNLLASFNNTGGYYPSASLVADSSGNLFGTTTQGPGGDGTVFEVSGTGFLPVSSVPPETVSQALASYAGNPSNAVLVVDTGANVAASLDSLESIAAAGKLSGVAFTDASAPTLSITQAQLSGDAGVFGRISSSFDLSITASSPNATIAGLGSHDIVILPGTSSQYSLTAAGDGTSLTATSSGSVDHLSHVNYLQFSDKLIFVENSDNANIARLYAAALDRAPDVAGLDGWEDIYANNVTAAVKAQGPYVALAETSGGYGGSLSIAAGFTNSTEFQTRYGALDDTSFINLMYNNVLGRAPVASETNAWLTWMTTKDSNGQVYTKEMVLVGFAESPENIAKTGHDWLFAV